MGATKPLKKQRGLRTPWATPFLKGGGICAAKKGGQHTVPTLCPTAPQKHIQSEVALLPYPRPPLQLCIRVFFFVGPPSGQNIVELLNEFRLQRCWVMYRGGRLAPRGKAMQVAGGRGENQALGEQKGGVLSGKALRGAGPPPCCLLPFLSSPFTRTWLGGGAEGKVAWAEVAYRHLSQRNPRKWGVGWASDSHWGGHLQSSAGPVGVRDCTVGTPRHAGQG